MRESRLQGIWESGCFAGLELSTTKGHSLNVVNQGIRNRDAGPDFFNCTILVNGVRLTGNAEIHLRSSDWNRHDHSSEAAYDNVILHIVLVDDDPVPDIHTVEIGNYITEENVDDTASRGNDINEVISNGQFRLSLEHLALRRLERKAGEVVAGMKASGYSWPEAFHISLCRSIGLNVNAIPFEWLARSTPFSRLRRHCDNGITNVEAMLFGQSSLLRKPGIATSYENELFIRYERFANKYGFRPISALAWKFMRMRPVNFPTIRISPLTAIK